MVNINFFILSKFMPLLSEVLYAPITKKYMYFARKFFFFSYLIKVNSQGLLGENFLKKVISYMTKNNSYKTT